MPALSAHRNIRIQTVGAGPRACPGRLQLMFAVCHQGRHGDLPLQLSSPSTPPQNVQNSTPPPHKSRPKKSRPTAYTYGKVKESRTLSPPMRMPEAPAQRQKASRINHNALRIHLHLRTRHVLPDTNQPNTSRPVVVLRPKGGPSPPSIYWGDL